MMMAISFSSPVFPYRILSGLKTSTIRQLPTGKPRIHKGETIKAYYKQRSQNREYCYNCMNGDQVTLFPNDGCFECGTGLEDCMPKHFADIKITERNIVSFKQYAPQKNSNRFTIYPHTWSTLADTENYPSLTEDEATTFIKPEGFTDEQEFYDWFLEAYDLTKARDFIQYRFEVVKKHCKIDQKPLTAYKWFKTPTNAE
jgi:hypothetical protein